MPETIQLEDPLGQDPTRPRTETILRYEYRNEPGRPPDSTSAFLLEGIARLPVNDHWAGRLRVEMPLVLTNAPSEDDPEGAWRFGSGDLLTEAAGIHYPNARWALEAGGQVMFPTARATPRVRAPGRSARSGGSARGPGRTAPRSSHPPAPAFPPARGCSTSSGRCGSTPLGGALATRPFLFGDGFTLADASVYGQLGMNWPTRARPRVCAPAPRGSTPGCAPSRRTGTQAPWKRSGSRTT